MSTRLPRAPRSAAIALVLVLAIFPSAPIQAAPADSLPPRPPGLQPWSSNDREMALKAAVVDAFDGVEKAMAGKNYTAALDLLTRLRVVLKHLADGLLRAAACYTKLGRLKEARERVQSFLALGEQTGAPTGGSQPGC